MGMLWIASALVTTSTLSSANGSSVISAVCSSTRPAAPVVSMLAGVIADVVAAVVLDTPQVHSDNPSGRQLLGSDQHGSSVATQIT
jgi:hypothetical protein